MVRGEHPAASSTAGLETLARRRLSFAAPWGKCAASESRGAISTPRPIARPLLLLLEEVGYVHRLLHKDACAGKERVNFWSLVWGKDGEGLEKDHETEAIR